MNDKSIIDCRDHLLTSESYDFITKDLVKIIHNEYYPRRRKVTNKIYKEKIMKAFIDTLSTSYAKKNRPPDMEVTLRKNDDSDQKINCS